MKYIDRKGNTTIESSGQDRFLQFLYTTRAGRTLLRPLVAPWVSNLGGTLMSTRLSAGFIHGFIHRNDIDMTQYQPQIYRSYNDFFTRKIRPAYRPVDGNPQVLISPCDAKVSVFPIQENGTLNIKHTPYTLTQLLDNPSLAARFAGGLAYVLRLTVDDYHRYCYPADGYKSPQIRIPGIFHTVNPIANDILPIYKMNTREYCLLRTQKMGTLLTMEVGALLVGKICNLKSDEGPVRKGDEKGRFEFGGSTIVLLVQKGKVQPDNDLLQNTRNHYETLIKMGESLGCAAGTDRL